MLAEARHVYADRLGLSARDRGKENAGWRDDEFLAETSFPQLSHAEAGSTQKACVATRTAFAISVNVRFLAGRNGNVEPSTTNRLSKSWLRHRGEVV